MKCSKGELNALDFGTHMSLMEEWNEGCTFEWGEADVLYGQPFSTVIHHHKVGKAYGVMIAVYRTDGEGDLRSLRVYDEYGKQAVELGEYDYMGGREGQFEVRS